MYRRIPVSAACLRPTGTSGRRARSVDCLAFTLSSRRSRGAVPSITGGIVPSAAGRCPRQQVSATAHEVDQHEDELAGGLVVVESAGAVVGHMKAMPRLSSHACEPSFIRRHIRWSSSRRACAACPCPSDRRSTTSAARWRLIEQPRKQFLALPLLRRQIPHTVAENDRPAITRHDVLELRRHVLGDIARAIASQSGLNIRRASNKNQTSPACAGRSASSPMRSRLRSDLGGVPRPAPRATCLPVAEREALVMFRGRQRHI